jgi:hypothetical protein
MSKAKKAALFLFLVVGVIVLWGALTGWTFSGRLPREGAKCTPGDDEKVENATEYVYDADKKCTVIQSCETDWKPNSSNTACISTLSGDTCTGSVENGIYKYDTSGECVFDSCVTGFEKSGTECISTLSGDTCTGANENGIYKYDNNGECVLDSCEEGFEKSGASCVKIETCFPTTTEYDPMQVGMCLGDDNKSLVPCPYKDADKETDAYKMNIQDITFKGGCGATDVAYPDIDGICHTPENIERKCNETPGCIGYMRFGNGCSRLMLNTDVPIHRYTVPDEGKDRPGYDIGHRSGVTLDQCKVHCDYDDECVGFAYRPEEKKCWWKNKDALGVTPMNNGYTFYKKGSRISTGS